MSNRMLLPVALFLITANGAAWSASSAYPIIISEESKTPGDALIIRYVKDWINCFECTNGELRKVVNSGAAANSFLDEVLADNPDFVPDRTSEFEGRWAELRIYADGASREVNITRTRYTTLQNESLRRTYHARAEKAKELIAMAGGAPVP